MCKLFVVMGDVLRCFASTAPPPSLLVRLICLERHRFLGHFFGRPAGRSAGHRNITFSDEILEEIYRFGKFFSKIDIFRESRKKNVDL